MFITITPLERPLSGNIIFRICRRVMDKINPPATQIRQTEVCGVTFTDVRVYTTSEIFPAEWRGSQRLSVRYALCPPEYTLPPDCIPAVTSADVRGLIACIWCNTSIRLLNHCGLPLYCRRIGIVDLECRYPWILERLIKHASEVCVYTRNRILYQGYADRILEEFGAPVLFSEEPMSMQNVLFLIHTDQENFHAPPSVPILSVCPDVEGGLMVTQPTFSIPEVETVRPPGIDHDSFYTALSTRCRLRQINCLSMQTACCGKRQVTLADIIEKIRRNQTHSFHVG